MSDLISRQDAKNLVWDELNHDGMAYRIMLGIDKLPSAKRTGKWIYTDKFGEWWQPIYRCSECGEIVANISNYCPRCGARMVEERKNEIYER